MRRTKEQVARDLPEKTVIDELIPLEGGQAALYESIRTAMDARIRDAIAARGLAASRITILDALLKLRQVCCDPRLVRLDSARKVTESAKRARLFALLEELVAEGRKILIFSQFVKMLRLIEGDVAARGWDYAMLHGSTKDRDVQVSNFQSGRPAAVPDQPEGGRHGSQPDRCRHRHCLRPLVEPGGGTAGHGPGAPDRPGQAGIRTSSHC